MLVERKSVAATNPELIDLLKQIRQERAFDPTVCVEQKVALINSYFRENNLSAAVIGLSGGIDSAVTLALLAKAGSQKDSPIKRILSATIPFNVDQGASNQAIAVQRAQAVAEHFNVEFHSLELGSTFESLRQTVRNELNTTTNAWTDGQLVAYLRTPALYYLSAILTANKESAIVCGTTNRDEGSYLGFFGKASDGMVDLQVISDLHKSEVYQLAKLLGVPASSIKADPTGDVFDNKSHLEMIGAPYDFVELYMHWLCATDAIRQKWLATLNDTAKAQFAEWAERIESMHKYNAHKYIGGNPSVHIDVYPRAVPGGWIEQGKYSVVKPERKLVNEFTFDNLAMLSFDLTGANIASKSVIPEVTGEAFTLSSLLSASESELLLNQVKKQKLLAVGRNGILKDYQVGDQIGSYRASFYSPELADVLWARIKPHLAKEKICDEFAMTDWGGHSNWKPIGINPAFRYIWYENGGDLVVHYDAGFNPQDGKTHSLMSLVLYLTDGDREHGGQTRFIEDPQLNLPYNQRDFSDWKVLAKPEQIIKTINPEKGKALIFDHRILHDAELWTGVQPRVIIRTDIMFEKVDAVSRNISQGDHLNSVQLSVSM